MTASHEAGPKVVYGYVTPTAGGDYNPDAGPSSFYQGIGFLDVRYGYSPGAGQSLTSPPAGVAWANFMAVPLTHSINAAPSTLATANIAALQAPTLNTPLNLVTTTGAGITASTAGVVVAGYPMAGSGAGIKALASSTALLAIDGLFAWLTVGVQSVFDPSKAIARAVSLTSTSNLSAINFTIVGFDIYGVRMSQTIAGPNNNTVNTTKCFKYIQSVTPNGTNAGTVSVGTADIYGFPLRNTLWEYLDIYWNGTLITSSTGWTTADTTNPATASTGDTRGSYAVQSASNGTKRLVILQSIAIGDLVTATPANFASLFGQTQA